MIGLVWDMGGINPKESESVNFVFNTTKPSEEEIEAL